MCTFSLTSQRCLECKSLADCLDESQPLTIALPEPRQDAPLKIIKRHCRHRLPREAFTC